MIAKDFVFHGILTAYLLSEFRDQIMGRAAMQPEQPGRERARTACTPWALAWPVAKADGKC
jgi:hypothetical protein